MLMGVVCTVDSRFCAVTTISWIWSNLLSSCANATFMPATKKTDPDTNPSILADFIRFIAFPRYQPRQEEWPAVDIMLHERGRACSSGDVDHSGWPGSEPPAAGGITVDLEAICAPPSRIDAAGSPWHPHSDLSTRSAAESPRMPDKSRPGRSIHRGRSCSS